MEAILHTGITQLERSRELANREVLPDWILEQMEFNSYSRTTMSRPSSFGFNTHSPTT
jgi:hypothetical protein